MQTHLDNGTPLGIDDLVGQFDRRIKVLEELAEFAVRGRGANTLTEALWKGIANLRDDWGVCEQAVEAQLRELYSNTSEGDAALPTKGV